MPNFQQNIKKVLKKLLKRDRLIIYSNKIKNMYNTNAKYYNKLINSCPTTTYKKSDDNIIKKLIMNHKK